MSLTSASLSKFTILFLILVVSFLPMFHLLGFYNSVYISFGLSIFYFLAGWYEVVLKKKRIDGDFFRVTYLPFMVICKRIIRVFFFMVLAALMMAPEVEVFMLVPILIIIAAGEIIFFLESVYKNCFSILFYPDNLFFMQDREQKIFAKEIRHIEYRYENFYLVLFNRGTIKINPEWMKEKDREGFHTNFLRWASENKIEFTEEAKVSLKLSN